MTIRIRSLTFWLVPCAIAGCSRQPATTAGGPPAAAPAVAIAPVPPVVKPGKPQPKSDSPSPAFPFFTDLAGTAVAKAVTPELTKPLPIPRAGKTPIPRALPANVLNPDPLAQSHFTPPLLALPNGTGVMPAAPKEQVPADFGAGGTLTQRPVLSVTTTAVSRATDVNVPPPAPMLGRPASRRVPYDDPTNELLNAEIASDTVKRQPVPNGMQKPRLRAQVAPKVPASAEPSAAPIQLNPRRP